MDKQNYTLKAEEIQEIKQHSRKMKRAVIRELEKSHIMKRKRVVKSVKILVHAVFKYITEELSFQRLADYMACHYNVVMSDTA